MSRRLVRNIRSCLTQDPSLGMISAPAILMSGGKIEWIGSEKNLDPKAKIESEIDAGGALVTPGLIDCHTHILFAGSRADEFFMRLAGESYEAIGKKGGGIARTTRATTSASDDELLEGCRKRLDRFLTYGVTTVEIKSGYGLSLDQELRLLRLIKKIGHKVQVVPTFLGAHVVPAEYRSRREAYVELVTDEMLPIVAKERIATSCDVFCDDGAFTIGEARAILEKAKGLGLGVRLHADQLKGTGAAELAVELGALSADHLEQISENGIQKLAASRTVAVLVPGAVWSLGKRTFPPARKLLEARARVAISTDCNPGTSFSENLPLAMSMAAVELKMTCDEIWPAVTTNAAAALALSDRGILKAGMRADLVIWDAEDPSEVPYHYGSARPRQVMIEGEPCQSER